MRRERLRRLGRLFGGWEPAERKAAATVLCRLNESLAGILDEK
jgi:hypothetical protein